MHVCICVAYDSRVCVCVCVCVSVCLCVCVCVCVCACVHGPCGRACMSFLGIMAGTADNVFETAPFWSYSFFLFL